MDPESLPENIKQEEKASQNFDYVIIVDRNIKQSQYYANVVKFLNYLQERGIIVELGYGNIKQNIYVKLHITDKSIQNFASIYDVEIDNIGHYYIHTPEISLKMCQTPLTMNRDIFRRKGDVTNAERIMIIYGLLCEARFGDSDQDEKYGIHKLLEMGAIKDVYPLHDGSHDTDRQMLLKYWANFSVWYKEQPLNLIEKYFGPEVAFYFAWLGFYNKMLIPASVVGASCFIFSIVHSFKKHDVVEQICTSNLVMCPRCTFGHSCVAQPLKVECPMAKMFVLFDNYATVAFAVFMSCWATLFINLWKRRENVLKIRWNVTSTTVHDTTQLRFQYKDKATHKRVSKITDQVEPYTPVCLQLFYYFLSFGACLLLVSVILLAVLGVITYRIIMVALIRMTRSKTLGLYAPFINACTSSVLQVIFIKMYGKFYAPFSEWLTKMENPRTQFEFDNSVVHKRYILGFANNYSALFYMAFFKGRFFWPGNTHVGSLRTDFCHTCGCMVAICIQLFVVMLLKSMAGNILTLVVPIITGRFPKKKVTDENTPQWEEEFQLYPAGRYLLTTEFMEIILQYGFVTLFVAAFPLAPLCALINNCMELRLDALKLVSRYRRPVPRRQSGIGSWGNILQFITYISIITNAFVLSFTSDLVAREIFKYENGNSLEGYIESTLSVFDMKDVKNFEENDLLGLSINSTLCYYKGLRYPPDHPKEYQFTNRFWHQTGIRLLCVIIFEHFILLTNGILAHFIPEFPRNLQKAVYHTKNYERESVLSKMNEE